MRPGRLADAYSALAEMRAPQNAQGPSEATTTASGRGSQAHTELFVGVVGPIGTDLDAVVRELRRQLKRYSYETSEVRLSEFLTRMAWSPPRDFAELPYDERAWQAMDAGNELRRAWDQYDALALLSIGEVEADRANIAQGTFDAEVGPPTIDRRAWVFRSLKTAEEVRTFRDVYGPRFFLIGAHCPEAQRVTNLRREIKRSRDPEPEKDWSHAPSQLIDRDWKEEHAGGQDVRGTFHQADFFIDAREPITLRRDLERVLDILFGNPYEVPTPDEQAMFAAAGAAKRSAELGRQVGAAIVRDRSVLALGANEVPKAQGGSYTTDDADDKREYRLGRDTNRARQEEIATGIDELVTARFAAASRATRVSAETLEKIRRQLLADLPRAILEATEVGDLTEFGRATHAEMSALLDAAHRGVPVRGATLFTTTFPCHNCARHVVEAGIMRLVFIEPYAKSRALDLHADSIALAGEADAANKVRFEPFVGVAPRRYLELFDAGWREQRGYPPRKDSEGWVTDFDALRPSALPVFSDLEKDELRPVRPVYRLREGRVFALLEELTTTTGLELKEAR